MLMLMIGPTVNQSTISLEQKSISHRSVTDFHRARDQITMATSTGHAPSLNLGCTVQELRDLMELRGNEACQALTGRYSGVQGLCQRLKTDPVNGM